MLALNFQEALPVTGKRDEIARAIRQHPVIIVCGETGSGKTTQLPKIALLAGCGKTGLIGHTQPRRLAATSVAKRIAQELNTPLGQAVGYKIRFNEQCDQTARIKLMTDGILLAESLHDPQLKAYDCLIIDEAHERSLNIDFLLGYLKQLVEGPRRGTLKVIITSATIDAERFAQHFGATRSDGTIDKAPVIEVSGRLYPVEVRYRPLGATQLGLVDSAKGSQRQVSGGASGLPEEIANEDALDAQAAIQDEAREQSIPEAIAESAVELWRGGPGDILVFMAGEREIRDAIDEIRRRHARSPLCRGELELLPLFSRLSAAEQERAFQPSSGFRMVLSTNVAETSLTVPGVRYVIDTGQARVKRYRYRSKVEQLLVEPISQAAANQRAGRCGRVANGICVRLFDEIDFQRRPRFTDPEILRSSLASVILRMKALRLGPIEAFPFLDRPSPRAIQDGYALLQELQALDDQRDLTPIGQQLARLPLDPRIARMLLAAREQHCLADVLIIAAALAVQDPRERPMEAQQAADQKHLRFQDERSDFVAYLKLWQYWQSSRGKAESKRAYQERLKREFLSPRRLREWADVQKQLSDTVKEYGWEVGESVFMTQDGQNNTQPPVPPVDVPMTKSAPTTKSVPATRQSSRLNVAYEKIHRSLLAGLLGNLGLKSTDSNVFLGTHEVKFLIHPGSGLARKPGKWVMAAELVETTRLYARHVAQIQPDWIEKAAGHLLRRSCSDARWEKKAAQVMAFERGVLYGLPIYTQRRVPFGAQNPEIGRELMIRGALVELEWDSRLPFMEHNRRLISEIEAMEHRTRRQDLLVDEHLLFSFFDAQIPEGIHSGAGLEQWWRNQPNRKLLFLSKQDLIRKSLDGVDSERFPAHWPLFEVQDSEVQVSTRARETTVLDLTYHFEPGSPHDGVTMTVPIHLLNQIDSQRAEWLVPGMLQEKVLSYCKTLPPKVRHRLQPIESFAQGFAEQHSPRGRFLDALRDAVKQQTQLPVLPTDFRVENIPPHCWFRFVVQDQFGRELASGRDLAALKAQFGQQASQQFMANANQRDQPVSVPQAQTAHRDWAFGALDEMVEIRNAAGQILYGYPALVAGEQGCYLQVYDDADEAKKVHRSGLRTLFAYQFKEQVKLFERHIPAFRDIAMQFVNLGSADLLKSQLLDLTLDRACMEEPWPRDAEAFNQRVNAARPRFGLLAQEVGRLAGAILAEFNQVQKKISAIRSHAAAHTDMTQQLQALVPPRFMQVTPYQQLVHLPRYLKAIGLRVDKLKSDPLKDAQKMAEIARFQTPLSRALHQAGGADQPRLVEFRWLLEELRVSLFAQELKTPMPVSAKRLEKFWAQIQQG